MNYLGFISRFLPSRTSAETNMMGQEQTYCGTVTLHALSIWHEVFSMGKMFPDVFFFFF